MKLPCSSCAAVLEITDPTGPSPGGVVTVQCPECGASTEATNPHGDETFYFDTETWLSPKVVTVDGARGTTRRAIVGYELAEPGDPGAVKFAPGDGIQRRLVPIELLGPPGDAGVAAAKPDSGPSPTLSGAVKAEVIS